MSNRDLILIKILGVSTLLIQCKNSDNRQAKISPAKPNIIYILADDLGYGDLGVYGQSKIETPNIDRLAAQGMLFTQHYSGAPVSAPARCVLLTGKHTGHSQVRGNDEWGDRGDVWNYRAMIADSTLEGQRPLATGTPTIASLLKKSGYTTGMIGKWGLGAPQTESIPTKMGFDYFFGINCQRMAHTYYPLFLYENDHRYYLDNDTIAPNTLLDKNADPLDPESYSDYNLKEYAPDIMFTKLTDFVNDNKNTPFFLYWATPIPHVALQAPQNWVDYYVDKFGDEKPYLGEKSYFPHRYPHAAYAAMISYLDDQVGNLIGQLKELGIYDNTLIIFTSDNGPTFNGGTDSPWFDSGGPFRSEQGYAKGNVNEGGIRVPMIASWASTIAPGSISDHVSAFWDIMPTLCEIAGIKAPDDSDGVSFLPELAGKKQKEHKYLYWEFPESGGQQAVITGKYKALRKEMHKGNTLFELYDLESDKGETKNIADDHPEIIIKVKEIIRVEHQKSQNPRWQFKVLGD
ncbi:MAG TPA: arylsulfatase [Bacteroidales bacterium]|nr:arylsulfatase [Bacteroidales bacterium]